MAVLDEFMRQTCFREIPFVPRFDKKAAFVLNVVNIKDEESIKRCFRDVCFHMIDRFIMNL